MAPGSQMLFGPIFTPSLFQNFQLVLHFNSTSPSSTPTLLLGGLVAFFLFLHIFFSIFQHDLLIQLLHSLNSDFQSHLSSRSGMTLL